MMRRLAAASVILMTVATTAVVSGGNSVAETYPDAGPKGCAFHTALITTSPVVPMKNAARLTRTECGYRYRAGQQDSNLVITQVGGKLRFKDTGTERIDAIPRTCTEIKVVRGIVAKCRIPNNVSVNNRLLIEVWPRLGNDFVDGSSLSAMFSLSVLGDGGNDTALLGAGPDFFNGSFDRDRVRGGAGNDWIRTGDGRDRAAGGPGADHITGGHAADSIVGGPGPDRLYCGPGRDEVHRDRGDAVVAQCEVVNG